MAKRLSEKQKEEILKGFTAGKDIQFLSEEFNCNRLTITRNLKKYLGEKMYKELTIKNKPNIDSKEKIIKKVNNKIINKEISSNEFTDNYETNQSTHKELNLNFQTFTEIIPLNQEIENVPRKELSSIKITEVDFPKVVYMVVNEKIDLEIKFLKEYPEWQFLSENELNRKTLEIFIDLKNAKRFCKSSQKVIKVPNTGVFKIVAPMLLSRGISRIVYEKNLIALW